MIRLFAWYFYKEQNFSSIIISDIGDIVAIFDKIYLYISYLVPENPTTTSVALEVQLLKSESKKLEKKEFDHIYYNTGIKKITSRIGGDLGKIIDL